jgi:hypothetical protein
MFSSSDKLYFEVYLDRKYFDNVDIILGWKGVYSSNAYQFRIVETCITVRFLT